MSGHDGALPNPRGAKLTYDDFVLFPDDGLRHELIDGEHYMTPSPNKEHQKVLGNLHLLVGDFNTLAPGELLDMQKLPMRYKVLAYMLGGRLTFRAIQLMLDAGYLDCYRRFNTDPGYTFPAWDPHVRLDYFFTPKDCIDRITSCGVIADINEPAKVTDHLPLVAEIALA